MTPTVRPESWRPPDWSHSPADSRVARLEHVARQPGQEAHGHFGDAEGVHPARPADGDAAGAAGILVDVVQPDAVLGDDPEVRQGRQHLVRDRFEPDHRAVGPVEILDEGRAAEPAPLLVEDRAGKFGEQLGAQHRMAGETPRRDLYERRIHGRPYNIAWIGPVKGTRCVTRCRTPSPSYG